MKQIKLTLLERETIILLNEREPEAEIYTYNKRLIKRLKRYPTIVKLIREDDTGAYTFTLPKKHLSISVRKPLKEKEMEKLRENANLINKQGLNGSLKNL